MLEKQIKSFSTVRNFDVTKAEARLAAIKCAVLDSKRSDQIKRTKENGRGLQDFQYNSNKRNAARIKQQLITKAMTRRRKNGDLRLH